MSFLGEFKDDYEDVHFEDETNTSKIYIGYNKKYI